MGDGGVQQGQRGWLASGRGRALGAACCQESSGAWCCCCLLWSAEGERRQSRKRERGREERIPKSTQFDREFCPKFSKKLEKRQK
jgi:hypothetical protein